MQNSVRAADAGGIQHSIRTITCECSGKFRKAIKNAIEKYFSYHGYRIILDWFHIKKHCYETMSMAIKGKKEYKHQVQAEFNRYIWIGAIDEAIAYLRSIDKSHIKNEFKLQETIDYLNRKKR